jgi:hypothetical protein
MSDVECRTGSVKPVFVDNRDGNTLARTITTHLEALRRVGRTRLVATTPGSDRTGL